MLFDDNDATLQVVICSVHFHCPHCGRNADPLADEIKVVDDDGTFRLIVNCPLCMGTVEIRRNR